MLIEAWLQWEIFLRKDKTKVIPGYRVLKGGPYALFPQKIILETLFFKKLDHDKRRSGGELGKHEEMGNCSQDALYARRIYFQLKNKQHN